MISTSSESNSCLVGQSWDVWLQKCDSVQSTTKNNRSFSAKQTTSTCTEKSTVTTKCDRLVVATLPHPKAPCYGICPGFDEFVLVQCSECGLLVKPMAYRHHFNSRHTSLLKPFPADVTPNSVNVHASRCSEDSDSLFSVLSPASVILPQTSISSDSSNRHDSFLLSPVAHEASDSVHFNRFGPQFQHSCNPCCSKDCKEKNENSHTGKNSVKQQAKNKVNRKAERNIFEKFSRNQEPSNNALARNRLKKQDKLNSREGNVNQQRDGDKSEEKAEARKQSYTIQQTKSSEMKFVISKQALDNQKACLNRLHTTPTKKINNTSSGRRKQKFFLSPEDADEEKLYSSTQQDSETPTRKKPEEERDLDTSDTALSRTAPVSKFPGGKKSFSQEKSFDELLVEAKRQHNSSKTQPNVPPEGSATGDSIFMKLKKDESGAGDAVQHSQHSSSSATVVPNFDVKPWDSNNNEPPQSTAVCDYGARRYTNSSSMTSGRGGCYIFGRHLDGIRLAVQMVLDPSSCPVSGAKDGSSVKSKEGKKDNSEASSSRFSCRLSAGQSAPGLKQLLLEGRKRPPVLGLESKPREPCLRNVSVGSGQKIEIKTELSEKSRSSCTNYTTFNLNKAVAMQKGDSNRNSGNGDGTPVRLADFADKCGTVVKVDPVDCERNSPIPSVPSNKSYTVTTVPITVNTSMFSAHPPHNYAKTEGSPPDCSEWSKKEFQQQVATWKEGNADQHQRIPLGLPPNVLARSGNLKRAFVPSFGNPPRKRPRQVKTNELNVNCVNSASPSPLSGVRQGGSTSAILIAASTPGGGSWQKPPRKVAADCGAVQGDLVSPGAAIFLDPSGKFLTLNTQNSSSNGATALVLPNKVQNGILLAKSSASFAKSGNVINSGQQSVVLGCVGAGSIGKTVVQSEGSSNCTLVPTGPAALVRVPISSGKLQNQHIGNPGLVQQAGTISLTSRNSAQSLSYHQFQAGLAQQVHIGRQQPQPLL